MRKARTASAAGIAALLVTLLASPSAAQYGTSTGAPGIHVFSRSGPGVASNYVTPGIEVSEDAYVFAVSMDLDGTIQVLHPDNPGISIRIRQRQQLRLPNFFAGFAHPEGMLDGSGQYAHSQSYTRYGYDTRGTVIALASRAPFNLDRITSGGDWNMIEIRQLIEGRSPASAAGTLASYLGARGEPIGRDYMRFAGAYQNYYASDAFYSCDLYGSSGSLLLRRNSVLAQVGRLQSGGRSVSVLGYDACGMPILAFGPSRSSGPARIPTPHRDPTDTTHPGGIFGHLSHRHAEDGTGSEGEAGPMLPAAESQGSAGDLFLPSRNERERREVPLDRRIDPRGGLLPGTTGVPFDRETRRHSDPPMTGTFPPREEQRQVIHDPPQTRSEPRVPTPPPQTRFEPPQRSEPRTFTPPPAPPPPPPPPQRSEPRTVTPPPPPPKQ